MSVSSRTLVSGRALDFWLGGYLLVLLAQFDRLPIWLFLVALAGGIAGWMIRRRGWAPLARRYLIPVTLVTAAGFWAIYRGQFTVDTAASFLVLTVALKWLEIRQRRDLFILFFIISYLVVVTLLFHQSILWVAVLLVSLFLLFTGLQLAIAGQVRGLSGEALRRSAWLFAKMLPIVIILFIFFPRMSPLWSVPLVSEQGVTGLSEEMTPGEISNLAQNSERAFRVSFGGDMPRPGERYWRTMSLDRFDGRTWRRAHSEDREGPTRVAESAPADELGEQQYEILMEPHYERWGFALQNSDPASPGVRMDERGLVRFERSVDTTRRYRLSQREGTERALGQRELSEAGQQYYTRLPESGNEKTRAWVAQQRLAEPDDQALIQRFMGRFNEEPFHYTLRPPTLGEDPVDELLYETQRGFCEHYASALAFKLRAAGIPARIMTGYLGGEESANEQYLIIRQYDAHAWVEAWLPEYGWFRLDPTAQIAPDRIEYGLEEAMREEGSFLEGNLTSPDRYRDIAWVNWLRLQADAINFYWQRWVVGYEGQTQMSLFDRFPGEIGMRELGLITAGLVAAIIGLAVIYAMVQQHRRRFRDPWHRLYDQWCRWLEKQGVPAGRGDPLSVQTAAAEAHAPELAESIREFGGGLSEVFYGPADRTTPEQLRTLRQLLTHIRRNTRRGRSRHTAAAKR